MPSSSYEDTKQERAFIREKERARKKFVNSDFERAEAME